MPLSSLKNQLIQNYTQENLNDITSKIIELNKSRNKYALKSLGELVNEFVPFDTSNEKKIFSKLVMLYHPDKLAEYQKTILSATSPQPLQELMHIVQVIELMPSILSEGVGSSVMTPEDFEEEYGWNYTPSESNYYEASEDDETVSYLFDEENADDWELGNQQFQYPEGSFLGAVKSKIYGPINIKFPVHLLEDMEEIEMADYDIEFLDGIEYCTYVKILDLSYNSISDIHKIQNCSYVQELYMADNKIYLIDALGAMSDLRQLDLSNNQVSDISVLYNLACLAFVNLMNNPVSQQQIYYLKTKGVVVVS